jgi:hypothetical protein
MPASMWASPSAAATTISRARAERIALGAVPGGRVRSAELESEHGVPVWSVDVAKGAVTHQMLIDARTGEVVRDRQTPAGRGHDAAGPGRAGHREPEPRDDHGREAEHRHGTGEHADHAEDHTDGADDDGHGRHGGRGEDHHGGEHRR